MILANIIQKNPLAVVQEGDSIPLPSAWFWLFWKVGMASPFTDDRHRGGSRELKKSPGVCVCLG